MPSPTKRREAFLESVHDENCDTFLNFVKQHHCKEFDLGEFLPSLGRKQIVSLWDGLCKLCNDTLISAPLEVDEFAEEKEEMQEAVNKTIACLDGILTVALCYLHSQDKPVIPQSFEDVTSVLHGVLLDFPKSAEKLQNDAVKLCELWWSKDLPRKEEVIKNAFIFLLQRTLRQNAHFAEVKRVYSLRQSLLLHDFGMNQSVELKQMLEQCVVLPVYLKADEGRRFLSFIFGMNPTFIEQLHSQVKTQLPACTKAMVKAYAEIYFRAWRAASGPYLEKLEVHCIQDFMYCAVHASRSGPKSMASILKQFMSHFHHQKKHKGVDEMLLRLYEPIIWRALKVANGGVRANAASLLLDAFPLEDPNVENAKKDEIIQKQLDALLGFLEDPCPLVRGIGVEGVCQITSVFWELMPLAAVQTLLTKLVREIAFDSASSEVRVSVFKGLSYLLSNHLCHGYLKALLPELKNCIHDNAEKVRIAFIELLMKIKGLKSLKFWHIVPMEWLLARMEVDSPSIVRRLVQLIFNSFMPIDKEGSVQASRCIALLQINQLAARRFYQYAHKDMPLINTVKFMVYLCQTVSSWVKAKQTDGDGDEDQSDDDDDNEGKENEAGLSDTLSVEIIEGMLETVAILWAANDVTLQKASNVNLKEKLIKKFSYVLPVVISSIESSRAFNAVVMIAGYLPASSMPYFSRSCLSKLKGQSRDAKEEYYGLLLDCMCKWNRMTDVFELITDWLKAGFSGESGPPPSASKSKRKTSKKSVKFNDPVEPQPELAVKFLTRMMKKTTTRNAVLQGGRRELEQVAVLLKSSMKCIERRLISADGQSELTTDEFLASALCSYCKLQIHLHAQDGSREEMATVFNELLTWAGVELIPVLAKKLDESTTAQASRSATKRKAKENQKSDVLFVMDLVESLLKITNEMVLLGVCCCDDLASLTDFCRQLIKTDHSATFLPVLTRLLYQMTQYCNLVSEDEEAGLSQCVVVLLGEIVKALAKFSRKNSGSSANVKELFTKVSALSDVLGYCEKYQKINPQLRQHIMAPVMTATVADVTNTIRKYPEFQARDNTGDLPTLSAFLLGIVCRTKSMTSFFVSELQQCVSAGALGTLQHYCAVVHILHALSKGRHRISNIKDCLLVAQQDLENMEFAEAGMDEENESPEREMFKSTVKLTKETLESIGAVA